MILFDDRLGSGKGGERIRQLLSCHPLSTHAELTRLDAGDIAFTGNGPNGSIFIGIELKSVLDLISSLDSHRLQGEQLPKMVEFGYDVMYLLHYGTYRPNPSTGALQIRRTIHGRSQWVDYTLGKRVVPYGYIESFLCSPSFTSLGILSHRVVDIDEAMAWVMVLYRTWSKKWSEHKSMRVLYDNTRKQDGEKIGGISTCALIPTKKNKFLLYKAGVASKLAKGIGYEKAMAAGAYFDSVESMVKASVDQWAMVPGIGKVLAKAITENVKRKGQ